MKTGRVSALVVTYHTGPVLRSCLRALKSDPAICDIVIVDNGNPPDMRTWLEQFTAQNDAVSYQCPDDNLGFGRAMNLAAKAAKADFFLAINPDAILREGAVEALMETGTGLVSPWIVGGCIEDEQGREQRGARRKSLTLWRAITSFAGLKTWALDHLPPPTRPVPMPVISGAFFLTSKASFNQLGGFDDAYFLHVEDVDLCRRCQDAGGQVFYHPGARAIHIGATSKAPARAVAAHKADSLALYFRRHGHRAERLVAALIMPIVKLLMIARAR